MEQTPTIKKLLPATRSEWIVYLLYLLVFIGFSTLRLIISISVIALIAYGLFSSDIRRTLKTYFSRPSYWLLSLYFLVILFSGINSDNKPQWLAFLQLKLPYLLLPIAFCGLPKINRELLYKILLAFTGCMFLSAMAVMFNYWLHYPEIKQMIIEGSHIPTPYSHIRYTLLLVFTFFSCLWLWEQGESKHRHLLLIPAAALFIVIHVLSSRSGWVALYAGLLFYMPAFIYRSRQYVLGLSLIALIVISPYVLYHYVESFKTKIDYMHYALSPEVNLPIEKSSDGMRQASWRTGVELIKRNTLWGVGVGDLLAESKSVSRELFPNIASDEARKMPHNEFIWIWAATGVFGFLAYCIAFFFPLVTFIKRSWLFVVLHIIFFTSFMTEPSLEEQIGTTFYLLFLLIFLHHFSDTSTAS